MASLQPGAPQGEPISEGGDSAAGISDWKPHFQAAENLAIALAALEASAAKQTQPITMLEAKTSKNYPLQLRAVNNEHCVFRNAIHQKTGKIFTLEDSILRRTADGKLWERWNRVLKPNLIKITPHYYHLTKHKDIIPSGKQQCDLLQMIKQEMWDEEQRSKIYAFKSTSKSAAKGKARFPGDKDNDVNSNAAESSVEADKGNVEPDTLASNVETSASHPGAKGSDVRNEEGYEKMPVGWDGGPYFRLWEVLGPLGMNVDACSVTPRIPSKRSAEDGGEGRKAVRHKERLEALRQQNEKRQENTSTAESAKKIANAQEHLAATQHYSVVCNARQNKIANLQFRIRYAENGSTKQLALLDELEKLEESQAPELDDYAIGKAKAGPVDGSEAESISELL